MADEREIRCEDATGCVLDKPKSEKAVNLETGEMVGRGGFLPLNEAQKPIPLKKSIPKPKSKPKKNKLKGKGIKKLTSSAAAKKKPSKTKSSKKKATKPKQTKKK